MSHGKLSAVQQAAVRSAVLGNVVHDLGCGDMELAQKVIEFGATGVIGIDRYTPGRQILKGLSPKIRFVEGYFHDFHEPAETILLSWPVNWYDFGLGRIIERAKTVIYLGTNTDGSACGYEDMWMHLSHREVRHHLPDRKNTLIIYGPNFEARGPLPEEYAALHQSRMYSFEELHQATGGGVTGGTTGAGVGDGSL